ARRPPPGQACQQRQPRPSPAPQPSRAPAPPLRPSQTKTARAARAKARRSMPNLTIRQIADACDGTLVDASRSAATVHGVAFIAEAGPDAVTWVDDKHYHKFVATARAAAIIGRADAVSRDPRGIIVDDPAWAIIRIL